MSGAFVHNLERSVYHVYTNDSGLQELVKLCPKYTSASNMPVATQAQIYALTRRRPQSTARHVIIFAIEDSPIAGRHHKRRVICNIEHLSAPGTISSVDGLAGWSYGTYTGENTTK